MRRSLLASLLLACSFVATHSRAQDAACEVSGRITQTGVRVSPDGVSPMLVVATGEAIASVPPDGREVPVRFRGVLEFSGTASPDELAYVLAAPLDLAGGLLSVRSSDRFDLHDVRTGADGVHAALSAEGVVVEGVLPCEKLRLSSVREAPPRRSLAADATRDGDPRARHAALRKARFWTARGERIAMRVSPDAAPAPIRITGYAVFELLEERAGLMRVRRVFEDGSVLSGWVEAGELVAQRRARPDPDIVASDVRPTRSRGRVLCERCFIGSALVTAGAPVFSGDEGRGPWARIGASIGASVEVVHDDGSDWVYVTSVPSLDIPPNRTWLRRADVELDVYADAQLTLRRAPGAGGPVVTVARVADGTAHALAGFRAGDRIVEVRDERGPRDPARLAEAPLSELRTDLDADYEWVIERGAERVTLQARGSLSPL